MTRSSQRLLFAIAGLVIGLGACSKGGTSLDQDAHKPREQPPGAGDGSDESMPCGNGKIDDGEDCDGAMLNGVTCENLGFAGGVLDCDPITCTYETSMCRQPAQAGGGGTGA